MFSGGLIPCKTCKVAGLLDGGVGFVGGSDQRSRLVQDDGQRDLGEHVGEMPFVFEGVEEGAVDHLGQNFYGDASGDVDSSKGENFEGKIARFGAVDRGPQIESLHTDRAGFVEAAFGDEGSRVGIGILEDRMLDARRDEFVQGSETAAGRISSQLTWG